jgi:Putative metallopeptidase
VCQYFRTSINAIGAVVGAALILPNLALAQSQTTATQVDRPNQVAVAYVAPNDPEFQQLYDLLKARRALEKIQEILSPLRLPEELTIKTMECGKVNSWYSRENSKPTVTICYELLKNILESVPKETTPAGVTPDDAAVGQFVWFTLHEAGHAVFDIFDVPIFGNEEDAADNFATYIMLQNQMAEARRLVGGAAWAWRSYIGDYRKNPVVQMRLEGFASDHGLPQERFYNLLCLAFGSNPVLFDDLARGGYLPPTRSPRCKREYKKVADAFQKEINPHIDWEIAKKVINTNWLPGPVLKRTPQK